ncbi:hypothetical protein SAY87_021630 [Trapa incisa]|uniref:Sister chromatid cohesion 1 protein 2 n=1 Tax=Trapa incisa TaxID=236973 RepID=A0AAN7JTQ7_9MYRT|nr:hypothetical protein SAY87_021630 [Trapa incisa]
MFDSQSLSRKGPLASIWVAAYCHKRLKKAQVTTTDIPFSVDMILQDDFEVITYRILGYFLLGVVRIYSKKVEYLFDDCHKVLIQVKGFVFREKSCSRASKSKVLDVPISLISLPERFELDAFDLDLGEEDVGGAHEMSPEAITLRDNVQMYERMDQYDIHEYTWEDIAGSHDIFLIDYAEAQDVLPLDYMDADYGFPTFEDHHRPFDVEKRAEREHMKNHEGASLLEKDKCFSEVGHDLLESTDEKLQEVEELEIRNASSDVGSLSEEDIFPNNEEDYDVNIVERLREVGAKENGDLKSAFLMDGETHELRSAEIAADFATEEANKPSEMLLFETPEPDVVMKDHSSSITVDSTSPIKVPNTAQGLDFSLKDNGRIYLQIMELSRLQSVFDNSFIKKNLRDASDLLCKRKKVPHNAFTAWKATRALGFSEPLIPYSASELWSLHYEMNLKSSAPSEDVEVPETVRSSEPPSVDGSLEGAGIAPETPVKQCSSSRRPFESLKESEEIRLGSPYEIDTLEKVPFSEDDHGIDFALMPEDFNPLEEDTRRLDDGWTGRTRTVARHLNKVFQEQKREGEAASLLHISGGRTRKESARLFYEILVLQSRGCISVEQATAYTDVLIRKLPQWELTLDMLTTPS